MNLKNMPGEKMPESHSQKNMYRMIPFHLYGILEQEELY